MIGLWVEVSWVTEFTVVIFLLKGLLSSLGNSDEVIKSELVGEVLVKVILEVLDKIHVLLDKVVSSYSWEREGSIIELPGVDAGLWVLTLLLQFLVDLHSLLVVLSVEAS